jgi:hypothetical protein
MLVYANESVVMDPLSVIASVAGISTAGISLSRAVYDLVSSVRNAPREVSAIAKGLSDLSYILRELRRVLKDGKDVYRRKLIRRVATAVKRVGRVQREIQSLLEGSGGLARLKWFFRKSKTMELLYAIESHKTGISMILHIMTLAIQLKQLSRYGKGFESVVMLYTKIERDRKSDDDGDNDAQIEADLARRQAENMVQMSYHSLRELTSEDLNDGTRESNYENEEDDASSDQQVQVRSNRSHDDATWLYGLVFSATVEARKESGQEEKDEDPVYNEESSHIPRDDRSASNTSPPASQSLILHPTSTMQELQALTQEPPLSTPVVNELLSELTTLTEDEIEGIRKVDSKANRGSHKSTEWNAADEEVQMIPFKDAVGRKFELPFHLIKEWTVSGLSWRTTAEIKPKTIWHVN